MPRSFIFLKRFSKTLCWVTLFLIFLGALVKSTESGLSVPDWPTTYGKFMFAYPLNKMAGGIKYEHTHRMLASVVGLLTLVLMAFILSVKSLPVWIKRLGVFAFLTVVLQGVLGGLTVLFFLPVWLSTFHGVLAQTFFLILIVIAYFFSNERQERLKRVTQHHDTTFIQAVIVLLGLIYIQLIIANVMRHAQAGLAIPDFPTMGWSLVPHFDQLWLNRINAWRFENDLDPVSFFQVGIHLTHRLFAFLILLDIVWLNRIAYKKCLDQPLILKTVYVLNMAVVAQIVLGISTVLTRKEVYTTTIHVTTGAAVLGLSLLLVLRACPLTWPSFKSCVFKK